jgi:hypothetical protein
MTQLQRWGNPGVAEPGCGEMFSARGSPQPIREWDEWPRDQHTPNLVSSWVGLVQDGGALDLYQPPDHGASIMDRTRSPCSSKMVHRTRTGSLSGCGAVARATALSFGD